MIHEFNQFFFENLLLTCKIQHFINFKSVLASVLVVIYPFFHGLFVLEPSADVLTFNLLQSEFPLLLVLVDLCSIILVEVAPDQE